jgi:hypothetical protein
MSKHTPGPWFSRGEHVFAMKDGEEDPITQGGCGCCNAREDGVYGEDNARLIAAAPKLLKALKELLAVADFISETVPGAGWRMAQYNARAAILEAEAGQ